jgi:hypothetical protein
MSLTGSTGGNNPRLSPRTFSPTDTSPSSRAAARTVPPWLAQAGASRMLYRVRLQWRDDTTRTGRREEIVRHRDPRKLLDLLRKVNETPDRVLLGVQIEAQVAPKWEPIGADYLAFRSAQRDRRDEIKATMARRTAARSAR